MLERAELTIEEGGYIQNRNVPRDCCSHYTCDRVSDYWRRIKINGMPVFLQFCKEHDDEFYGRMCGDIKDGPLPVPTLEDKAADKKARKKFNKECWGTARYMAYDDTLCVDCTRVHGAGYAGYVGPLSNVDESLHLLGHFCSKVGSYFVMDQLVDTFRALGLLWDIPVDVLFSKVLADTPYAQQVTEVRSAAVSAGILDAGVTG